ncbi:hypothetical protein IE4872_CH03935 [Rhizobium gallicum]|uniref:Uncharacterized protein n=1 Tax=Rhizobium gallicum TaxID=56730 RepID=A0A1L5NNQ8_9HYPH|nr:hypothetical protein [Rhizobium gallicum]APO69518.1 hypothetical protein IE4872_CH03935 [Rhizobium gallicum]
MGKYLGLASFIAAVRAVSPVMAAERYKLRAPGGLAAAVNNEVGVWKTANGAQRARSSLAAAGNAAFGGCRGCVKTELLSAN